MHPSEQMAYFPGVVMSTAPAFHYTNVDPETRAALVALCQEYVWRIDFGYAETIPELFTEHGSWSGPWGEMTGQAELATAWTRRATETVKTRHMLTSLRFTHATPDEALGWVGQIVFVADETQPMGITPSIIAENMDTYERGPDGLWRFSSRRVVILAQ